MLDTMRVFIALNLDIGSTRRIAELSRFLRDRPSCPFNASSADTRATWVAATKMHITLKFYGSIDVGLAAPLSDVLRSATEGQSSFAMRPLGVTGFPSTECARVIVVEFDEPSGDVLRLFKEIEATSEQLGFAPESRRFRPHVTIARSPVPVDAREWLADERRFALGDCSVTEGVLYKSDLARPGAEYTALSRVPLVSKKGVAKLMSGRKSERPSRIPPKRTTSRPPESTSADDSLPKMPRAPVVPEMSFSDDDHDSVMRKK